jgi:hypothetical protein
MYCNQPLSWTKWFDIFIFLEGTRLIIDFHRGLQIHNMCQYVAKFAPDDKKRDPLDNLVTAPVSHPCCENAHIQLIVVPVTAECGDWAPQ